MAAKFSREEMQSLHAQAKEFVEDSLVLRELVQDVQCARGRIYLWREPEDLMTRVTPLAARSMLLDSPHGYSWTEHKRGLLKTVLKAMENDRGGTFHGLGWLAASEPEGSAAQVRGPCRAVKVSFPGLAQATQVGRLQSRGQRFWDAPIRSHLPQQKGG